VSQQFDEPADCFAASHDTFNLVAVWTAPESAVGKKCTRNVDKSVDNLRGRGQIPTGIGEAPNL